MILTVIIERPNGTTFEQKVKLEKGWQTELRKKLGPGYMICGYYVS